MVGDIDEATAGIIVGALFGTFLLLLTLILASLARRVWLYRQEHVKLDPILKRDILVWYSIGIDMAVILAARTVFPDDADLRARNLIWLLITTIPSVFAVAVFLYYELFIIERRY